MVTTLFFVGIGIFLICTIIGLINFAYAMKTGEIGQQRVVFHFVLGAISSLGATMGAISGIIWIVNKFTS